MAQAAGLKGLSCQFLDQNLLTYSSDPQALLAMSLVGPGKMRPPEHMVMVGGYYWQIPALMV